MPVDEPAAEREVLTYDALALRLLHYWCADHAVQCQSAVLYRKPPSVIEPDYVWRRTDRWVNFPWSWQDPVAPSAMVIP